MPELLLSPSEDAHTPHIVFRGRQADIYELPMPRRISKQPDARSATRRGLSVNAQCNAPSHLLRRELSFPGWHALVNGLNVPITTDTIFQAIDLPAGESRVQFSFAPPHILWGYAAAVFGAIAMCPVGRKRFFFEKKKQKTFLS